MAFDNLWTECAECGEEIERETLFEKAFDDVNDQEAYSVAKDGGMPSVTTCPICDRESWSRWDRKCVFCNEDRLICELCETECDPEDYNTLVGLCSSCSWGMQKAMRDD